MRIGDWVEIGSFPLVVQRSQIDQVRAWLDQAGAYERGDLTALLASPPALAPPAEQALRGLVEQYFIADAGTQRVVQALFESLRGRRGGAFLVRGVYGSGKSHLLGLLQLLLEYPVAWAFFLRSHPEWQEMAMGWLAEPPLLVVAVSLDEFGGGAEPLEEILWQAAERELRRSRYGLSVALCEAEHALALLEQHVVPFYRAELEDYLRTHARLRIGWRELCQTDRETALAHALRFVEQRGLPLRLRQSRVEALGRLFEVLPRRGLAGVVFLMDEVSLFLGQRAPAALQADAAFLQFLGQRSEHLPLWVVGTLQKNLEDVGDVDHYILSQIKDRYQTRLTLSLAAAREVVSRKLIRKRDPERFAAFADQLARHWRGDRRRPTADSFAAAYPLHPLTLDLLETLAGGFLSQTRSVLEFVQSETSQRLECEAHKLVLPESLFTHFARELGRDPALARYHAIEQWYAVNSPHLFGEQSELGLRLVRLLLVLRLAEKEATPLELADLLLPAGVPGREEQVTDLLEILRRHGRHVDWRRREDRPPVYFLDLDLDLNEALRRRVQNWLALLGPTDGRVLEQVVQCCQTRRFRLPAFRRPGELRIVWRNTERTVTLHLRDLNGLSPQEAANQWAYRAAATTEERLLVWLATPFRPRDQRCAWQQALQQAWPEAQAAGLEERWRAALLAWLPRPLKPEETEALRLFTAHALLLDDPELLADREGERLLERVREGEAARRQQAREILEAAYFEGEILSLDGVVVPGEGLSATWGDWLAAVQQAAESAFERLFPRFGSTTPRRRLFQGAATNEIINEFIVPGMATVTLSHPLAGYLLDYAAPLGLVEGQDGDFHLRVESTCLVETLLEWLPPRASRPLTLAEAEQRLAHSPFGLIPEQTQLLVAALIRKGWITAQDAAGQPVAPARLQAPLRAAVATLGGPEPVEEKVWQAVLRQLEPWIEPQLALERTPAGQQALWERLSALANTWRQAAEILEGGCESLRQAWGQEPLQWRRALALSEGWQQLAEAVDRGATARAGLRGWAEAIAHRELLPDDLLRRQGGDLLRRCQQWQQAQWQRWARLREELDDPRVRLVEHGDLAVVHHRLHRLIQQGDAILFEPEFPAWVEQYDLLYRQAYRCWHQRAHAPERFEPYLHLRNSIALRLLQRTARLPLEVHHGAGWFEGRLSEALAARCAASGELPVGETVCPSCRLALGRDLTCIGGDHGRAEGLPPPADLEAELLTALQDTLLALRQSPHLDRLQRAVSSLPPQDPVRQAVISLLHLEGWLDEQTLAHLDRMMPTEVVDFLYIVLTTGAVARRRLATLASSLAGRCLTKRQLYQAFDTWLDPDRQFEEETYVLVE